MDTVRKTEIVERADKIGPGPLDQTKVVGAQDINPRIERAEKAGGDAGVKTPWENSHQIAGRKEPHWEAHHYNSQGRDGKTDWQHKGAERGDTEGPDQRQNPWYGLNTDKTNALNQSY